MSTIRISMPKQVQVIAKEIIPKRMAALRPLIMTSFVEEKSEHPGHRPEYSIYSHSLAISDMNGMICFSQQALRGFSNELCDLKTEFERQIQHLQESGEPMADMKYHFQLIVDLLEDIISFVAKMNETCDMAYRQRSTLLRNPQKNTDDCLELKVLDERMFIKIRRQLIDLRQYCLQLYQKIID